MADASIGNLDADVLLSYGPPVKSPGRHVARVVLSCIPNCIATAKLCCGALVQSFGQLLKAKIACMKHIQWSVLNAEQCNLHNPF